MLDAKLFIDSITPQQKYPGRKGADGTWQKILSEIPKCEIFIDAMCGSGYIGSLVKGCHVIFNDIDGSCIDKITYAAAQAEFRNEDYTAIIKRFDNGNKNRVFYFDPPYLLSTRSSQRRLYSYDWDNKDHVQFLKAANAIKSPAIISHYPCSLYDKALKKWRKITYRAKTRGATKDESLYMNFPQPVLLQSYAHVGTDFIDRQRIKRKVDSLELRLKNLPAQERAAILSSIIDRFSYAISAKQ